MQPVRADSSPLLVDRNAKRRAWTPRVIFSYMRQVGMVVSFFACNLTMAIPCLVYSLLAKNCHKRGREFIRRSVGGWLRVARLLGTLDVDFPRAGELQGLRGTIVVCNHPSLIDALILLSILPNAVCIMRGDLSGSLVLGAITRMAGYVPNDSGRAMVREGSRTLKEGGNLLIFPEGTRTRTEPVNIFKKGFALVAEKSGVPIQTVLIERTGTYLSKQSSLFDQAELPLKYRIHLGAVFRAEKRESPQELAYRIEAYFLRNLKNDGCSVQLAKSQPDAE